MNRIESYIVPSWMSWKIRFPCPTCAEGSACTWNRRSVTDALHIFCWCAILVTVNSPGCCCRTENGDVLASCV